MSRIYFEKFLSEEDFEYFSQLAFNEETMVMNYGRVFSLEEAKKFYKGIMNVNTKHADLGYFKVFERTTDKFIGLGALSVNDDFTEAEVEYLLLPDYWGKRYGSEMVGELLKKAEETKSIQKVIGIIDPNNIGSRKILINNDFVSCKIYEVDDGTLAEMFSKEIIHYAL